MEEGIVGFLVAIGTYLFGWVLAVLIFNIGTT